MVHGRDFEEFAVAEFLKMGLNRTLGRGRGTIQRVTDNATPGHSNSEDVPVRVASVGNAENVHAPENVVDPTNRREVSPLLSNVPGTGIASQQQQAGTPPHIDTSQTSGGTASQQPAGHSTLDGAGQASSQLVTAFRDLLNNENRDDALARLFASLMTNQQQASSSYRVIPDLSRNIAEFSGDDGISARAWIENLEAMHRLHEWPDKFLFESARAHLTGGARDWLESRVSELRTWHDFNVAFRETFIVRDDISTRWSKMKARVQGKNESLSPYFHSKVKLCSSLSMTFRETKAEVLIGLWSRELCNTVMATMQYTTDQLLHDIMYYESVFNQRVERIRSTREPSTSKPRQATSKSNGDEIEQSRKINNVNATSEKPVSTGRSSDNPRKCYNCNKTGHISRDCPDPRREIVCYGCRKTGHISRNCPNNGTPGKHTVQTIGQQHDCTATKYLKLAQINGREIQVFIDPGSSDCTIRVTRALTEQFAMTPTTDVTLKGFGPPDYLVSSPGVVRANIVIDGAKVSDVLVHVVPDDVQVVDVIIGRTFTDHSSIDYHKVGNTLTFEQNSELPATEGNPPTSSTTTADVVVPAHSINFVNVMNDHDSYAVPVSNLGVQSRTIRAGETTLRGEVSRLPMIERPEKKMEAILIDDLDIGIEQPREVAEELCQVVNEYRDCISTGLHDLGYAKNISMDIRVDKSATPVSSKPYRATEGERKEIKKILREWREAGIITDTQSAYASPVLLVKKKTGESRLCVDFRKLNQVTERVHFPLPNIDDHLAQIRDSSLFIVLDLAHGYLQIPLTKEAREKTAIITSEETAEFTRMVFGLMNGPAFFSKAMHQALGPLRDNVVLFYLDDILIPGKNWEELKSKLRLVFDALREAGLTIKLAKCQFLYQRVPYLGHVISANGIEPGGSKVAAIENFPVPRNVHEVRRYLGLTSYFRKFVPRFAQIAEPLSNLLRANVVFEWGDAQREAFEGLKRKLTEHPILQTFNPRAETELHTDASAAGLASMLMQRDATNQFRLVYAVSRRTSEPESRYHSSKLELLAIVWAVTRLRPMLANIPFTVVTDCQALCHLSTQKTMNPQIIRWNDLLSDYDYRIVHRPGVRLAHVDALSRAPVEPSGDVTESLSVMSITNEVDEVRMYQYIDDDIREKKLILERPASERTKHETSRVNDYELSRGIVYKRREGRLLYVIPNVMRKSVVVRFHDLKSHPGVDRTVARIGEHYYFPRMKAYVKRHVRACLQCLACKSRPGKQAGELHPIPPGSRPFAVVHMDHLGPFVSSSRGNKYVLAIVDNLTKFAVIRAVRDTKSSHVLRILEEFVREYGAPIRIVSDRGTCFTSKSFEQFCERHGIRHTLNSPRHPQANGQVERLNATLVPAIQSNLIENEGRTWDTKLRYIQSDLNEMRSASTGKSPFELVYGFVPQRDEGALRTLTIDDETTYRQPTELQTEARENIIDEQKKMKIRYDAHRRRNVDFAVGNLVYMKTVPSATGESTKLHVKYRGPLVIAQKLPSDTYRVVDLNSEEKGRRYASTAHASQLKLWEPASSESDEESFDETTDLDTLSNDEIVKLGDKENLIVPETSTKSESGKASASTQLRSDKSSDIIPNSESIISPASEIIKSVPGDEKGKKSTDARRPQRNKQVPVKLKDYICKT